MRNVKHLQQFVPFLIACMIVVAGQSTITPIASAHTITPAIREAQRTACLQPPQNVNLLTLSDARLDSYGLPNHTTINEDPQYWSRVLAHAKHHSCGQIPLHQQVYNPISGSSTSCSTAGKMCPSNWAGNILMAGRGYYREAFTEFYVPSIPSSPSNADAGYWAGIGGDKYIAGGSSQVLVQAGVETNVSGGTEHIDTWYEVYGTGTQSGCTINPTNLPLKYGIGVGDDIQIDVYSNSAGYSNQDAFFIYNISRNDYNSARFIETTNCLSDSATAEWIVEQPGSAPLPDFTGYTSANKGGSTPKTLYVKPF